MTAYYNEIDSFAADWLEELIRRNLIADGVVDRRSITEVAAKDIKGFAQCHFFAGIGVWSYALRKAGWPDDRKVWTGSCPCQPFSSAGKQKGFKDERHLFPTWFRLIRECRPDKIFGEQVAGKAGKEWLDLVSTSLENEDYAIGSAITSAASFGAPHIRQRLYFVGDASKRRQLQIEKEGGGEAGQSSATCKHPLADDAIARLERSSREGLQNQKNYKLGKLTKSRSQGNEELRSAVRGDVVQFDGFGPDGRGFWKGWQWLAFSDEKRRPIEPGSFPLVDGTPARMGRLRGYGNALCAPQAQGFVEAYMEVADGTHK